MIVVSLFILLDRCSAAEIDFVHSENVSFYRNIHSAEVRNMLDLHDNLMLHCICIKATPGLHPIIIPIVRVAHTNETMLE